MYVVMFNIINKIVIYFYYYYDYVAFTPKAKQIFAPHYSL